MHEHEVYMAPEQKGVQTLPSNSEYEQLMLWGQGDYHRKSAYRSQRARAMTRIIATMLALVFAVSSAASFHELATRDAETVILIRHAVFSALTVLALWSTRRNPSPLTIWLVEMLDQA